MKSALFTLAVFTLMSLGKPSEMAPPPPTVVGLQLAINGDPSFEFTLDLTGTPGAWVNFAIYCYLDPSVIDSSDSQGLTAYTEVLSFLGDKSDDMAKVADPISGDDPADFKYHTISEATRIVPKHMIQGLYDRAVIGNDAGNVKYYFQHLDQSQAPSASLQWNTNPIYWFDPATNHGSIELGNWGKRAAQDQEHEGEGDPNNLPSPRISTERCVLLALRNQIGRSVTDSLIKNSDFRALISRGAVKLAIQPFSLIDDLAVQTPGGNGGEGTGLLGLESGPPSVPPKVQLGSPPVKPIVIIKPPTSGGLAAQKQSYQEATDKGVFPRKFSAKENGNILLPVDGVLDSTTLIIKHQGILYALPGEPAFKFGHMKFPLPSTILAGDAINLISLENSMFGATPFDANLPALIVEP